MVGPGYIVVNVAMLCRYAFVPVSIYMYNELSEFRHDYNYLNEAILLMLFEQIAIFIAIRHYSLKKQIIMCKSMKLKLPKTNNVISFLLIIYIIYLAISYKNLGSGLDVLQSGALNEMREIEGNDFEGSHYIDIIWQSLCVWLFTFVVIKIKDVFPSKEYIAVSLSIFCAVIYILISFIDQTGLSRWYTIITTGSCVSFLCWLYPSKQKHILTSILVPGGILVFFATLFKNGGLLLGGDMDEAVLEIFSPNYLDTYFSGPVNVNNAIGVIENSGWNISHFFSDIIISIPILNHYIDVYQTTPTMYNSFLGRIYENDRGDQIIPLLGQSSIYLSYFLSPLLSMICIIVSRKTDKNYINGKSALVYMYAFVAIWFGITPFMLNFVINFAWWWIKIIPFFLILYYTSHNHKVNV